MGSNKPARWLVQRAAIGVKELPSNTAWVVSKALPRPVENTAGGAKDTARRATAAVQDGLPVGDGSLETRLARAREATDRAQRAEDAALAEAREAKQLADEANAAAEEGRERLRKVKSEGNAKVKQRVADARRRADEIVEGERAKAQGEVDEEVRTVSADVEKDVEKRRERAEATQHKAAASISDATEQMAEARRLADEAAKAAQEAAVQAQRQAEELADDARRRAGERTDQVAEAQKVQRAAAAVASDVTKKLQSPKVNGDVKSMTRNELMALARTLGVESRTSMNKPQLVAAVRRKSKKAPVRAAARRRR